MEKRQRDREEDCGRERGRITGVLVVVVGRERSEEGRENRERMEEGKRGKEGRRE